jgi:hypothetical protein
MDPRTEPKPTGNKVDTSWVAFRVIALIGVVERQFSISKMREGWKGEGKRDRADQNSKHEITGREKL